MHVQSCDTHAIKFERFIKVSKSDELCQVADHPSNKQHVLKKKEVINSMVT